MFNKQCILALGGNQFQRERALIGIEKATDATVVTVSPNAPFHENKFAAKVICANETNAEELLQAVQIFLTRNKMDLIGVIPLNDFVLNAGLFIAKNYNLPYNSAETIRYCRYKNKLKEVLAAEGLPTVMSQKFSNVSEAEAIALKLGFPVVIKPVNFGGSGGVKKVHNLEELEVAFNESKQHLSKFAKKYDSESDVFVIEPYISRDMEVSVEILNTPNSQYLVGITDKFLGCEPYFSEIAHLVPSKFMYKRDITHNLSELAMRACKALRIQFGLAHIEIKLNKDGSNPIIIEVGARPAGDGIMDLYEKSTGFNYYKAHCEAYLGRLTPESLPQSFNWVSAVGYLHPSSGFIDKINYDLSTEVLIDVDSIKVNATEGLEVKSAQNWSTRYGYVEFSFSDHLTDNIDLLSKVKIITENIFQVRK